MTHSALNVTFTWTEKQDAPDACLLHVAQVEGAKRYDQLVDQPSNQSTELVVKAGIATQHMLSADENGIEAVAGLTSSGKAECR